MSFKNDPATRKEIDGIVYFMRENIVVNNIPYHRLAIQTHFIERGESYIDVIGQYVVPIAKPNDILSISEKVISMCQNNIVEKKDVKLGFFAKFLSKFATSNSHGIAMDEPYKLQLAINIAGLPRILWACVCSAVSKLFGKKGVFYKIVGHDINGIDGFYPGSSFEIYHNIAILNPKDPYNVCDKINQKYNIDCLIVDANDLNIEILGKSSSLSNTSDDFLKDLIKDNPSGQSDELTPLILIRKNTDNC